MKQFSYTITLKQGMHARPAALLAEHVTDYDSTVTLVKEDKELTVTNNMVAILGMTIKKDDTVIVKVEGTDEDLAVEKLEQFFKENF